MSELNPLAIQKLEEFRHELVLAGNKVAKTKPSKPYDAWTGGAIAPQPTAADLKKSFEEYKEIHQLLGELINGLQDPERRLPAVQALGKLKGIFDATAAKWRAAAKAPYASKYEEHKLAAQYTGYSQHVEAALKLL